MILAGTLAAFNLPLEGVVLIMGVDQLLDMARTTINLIGNCLATAVMARWEGEFNLEPTDETSGPRRVPLDPTPPDFTRDSLSGTSLAQPPRR